MRVIKTHLRLLDSGGKPDLSNYSSSNRSSGSSFSNGSSSVLIVPFG